MPGRDLCKYALTEGMLVLATRRQTPESQSVAVCFGWSSADWSAHWAIRGASGRYNRSGLGAAMNLTCGAIMERGQAKLEVILEELGEAIASKSKSPLP